MLSFNKILFISIVFAVSQKTSCQDLQLRTHRDYGYDYININSKAFYVYDTINISKIVNPDDDFMSVTKTLGKPFSIQDNSNIARNEYIFSYPGLDLFFNNDEGAMRLVAFDITGQDCALTIFTSDMNLTYPMQIGSDNFVQRISKNNARVSRDEEKIINLKKDKQSGGKFFGEIYISEGVLKKVRIYI